MTQTGLAVEKISAKRNRLFIYFPVLLAFILIPLDLSQAINYSDLDPNLPFGQKVPLISLLNTLTEEECHYLGVHRRSLPFYQKKNFSLKEIQADYIILEFLNRYCVSCLSQAPIIDKLYRKVMQDDTLRDRVKVLAIGVGNNQREVQQFRDEKKVSFPMIPDPEFEAYDALGNPGGTPFLLIIRKTSEGEILAESHLGFIENEEILFRKVQELFSFDMASFQDEAADYVSFEGKIWEPPISLTEEVIQDHIGRSILQGDGQKHLSIQKKDLSGYGHVYIADLSAPEGRGRWFAKVYIKAPVCDVCHPVYFLLIFNEEGIVTDFVPLYITKYGNIPITSQDIQNLKGRIVGRNLENKYQFHPEYDSITGATISTSLIFHGLNKAGGLYRELQRQGYTPGHQAED
ncbi:MAG: TlpA disulfide reductase family protein [bacterium]